MKPVRPRIMRFQLRDRLIMPSHIPTTKAISAAINGLRSMAASISLRTRFCASVAVLAILSLAPAKAPETRRLAACVCCSFSSRIVSARRAISILRAANSTARSLAASSGFLVKEVSRKNRPARSNFTTSAMNYRSATYGRNQLSAQTCSHSRAVQLLEPVRNSIDVTPTGNTKRWPDQRLRFTGWVRPKSVTVTILATRWKGSAHGPSSRAHPRLQ